MGPWGYFRFTEPTSEVLQDGHDGPRPPKVQGQALLDMFCLQSSLVSTGGRGELHNYLEICKTPLEKGALTTKLVNPGW